MKRAAQVKKVRGVASRGGGRAEGPRRIAAAVMTTKMTVAPNCPRAGPEPRTGNMRKRLDSRRHHSENKKTFYNPPAVMRQEPRRPCALGAVNAYEGVRTDVSAAQASPSRGRGHRRRNRGQLRRSQDPRRTKHPDHRRT